MAHIAGPVYVYACESVCRERIEHNKYDKEKETTTRRKEHLEDESRDVQLRAQTGTKEGIAIQPLGRRSLGGIFKDATCPGTT